LTEGFWYKHFRTKSHRVGPVKVLRLRRGAGERRAAPASSARRAREALRLTAAMKLPRFASPAGVTLAFRLRRLSLWALDYDPLEAAVPAAGAVRCVVAGCRGLAGRYRGTAWPRQAQANWALSASACSLPCKALRSALSATWLAAASAAVAAGLAADSVKADENRRKDAQLTMLLRSSSSAQHPSRTFGVLRRSTVLAPCP